jgi:phosphoserine phosphatase SerB
MFVDLLDYVLIIVFERYDAYHLEHIFRKWCYNLPFTTHFDRYQILRYINKNRQVITQAPAALKYWLKVEAEQRSSSTVEAHLRSFLQNMTEETLYDLFLLSKKDHEWPKYLACFDMDSCLLANECIDEMGLEVGKKAEIQHITHMAMTEGLDFTWSLHQRLALIQGLSEEKLQRCWERMKLNKGALRLMYTLREVLRIKTALISGGFTYFSYTVADRLHMDYAFSNILEIKANVITGALMPIGSDKVHVLDGPMKRAIMKTLSSEYYVPLCLNESYTMAMGDGANDHWMVGQAGLGIAYRPRAKVLREATPHHLDICSLDAIPFLFSNCPEEIITEDNLDEDTLDQPPCKL